MTSCPLARLFGLRLQRGRVDHDLYHHGDQPVGQRRLTGVECFPHASPISPTVPGKQKAAPRGRFKSLIFREETGAGEGIRTLDPNLGKVVLYP